MRAPTAHDRADFWCVFFYVSGAVRSVIWPTYIPISNSSRSVLHDRIHRRVEEERKKNEKKSDAALVFRAVPTPACRDHTPFSPASTLYIYICILLLLLYIYFFFANPASSLLFWSRVRTFFFRFLQFPFVRSSSSI